MDVPANSYFTVQISENWFTGHITASYVVFGKRYITYANELNNLNKTLSSYNNIVYVD